MNLGLVTVLICGEENCGRNESNQSMHVNLQECLILVKQ